jgi:DNA-binding transcriptional MocR family regulator
MAGYSIDRFVDRYARRTAGMSASEVRALFAVASRPEVISLAGGMPYVQALPSDDLRAVMDALLDDLGATAMQYGGGQGQPGLRETAARLMAEEAIVADPEDVIVTTGAQQALDLIGKIFLDPGDVVALDTPAYVGALTAFGAYEPRFLPIASDQDGLIVEDLERALLSGERPSFVYTVPNFGNPAGVTLSYERRHRLVALCREAGIPIVEDNPYGLLRFEGDPLPCLRSLDPENVIYLGTVSKTFSPGVRVGWALAEQSVVQRLILAKEASDLCGSNLTMLLTERWFADDARWRTTLVSLVDTYRARRDAMLESIEEHLPEGTTWTVPAGGFYVWVSVPEWLDTRALLAKAVEQRVAYVPGTAFYPDGRGTDQLRLAFCYPTEDRIREGVARLGALLEDESALYRSLGS